MHSTIKSTSVWSKISINFLDVLMSLENGDIETHLYVKLTDSSSSCHPSDCKMGTPYSPPLRLNRICSKSEYLDNRCDDVEVQLRGRGYNDKLFL